MLSSTYLALAALGIPVASRFTCEDARLSLFPILAARWSVASDESGVAGKGVPLSAAIVDSRSVKMTEVAQEVGYDGAKLIKDHKRHLLVDTLGLLLQVIVGAASVSEKAGVNLILEQIRDKFPPLNKIFSDGDYLSTARMPTP